MAMKFLAVTFHACRSHAEAKTREWFLTAQAPVQMNNMRGKKRLLTVLTL